MAPLLYFNDTPYRAGISTSSHEPDYFTHTGTWVPELTREEQLDERKKKLRKQMSKKRRETAMANPSKHRTASMDMGEGKEESERLYSPSSRMQKRSIYDKKEVAKKHAHGHKMLAEMILRGDSTRHFGKNSSGGRGKLPYDSNGEAGTPVKKDKKARYVPNPNDGIPQPDFTSGRFTSTVSIRPPHSKRSTVRMGFSGHAPSPSKTVDRCKALDDLDTKRLVDTPVIVSEGVLRGARGINILRTAGEFPHRERVPLDEKIRFGKEINRKPDTLRITKAGGFTWGGRCEDMPWPAQETCKTDYMRGELDWLKDGAFIKAEDYGRPRTKGLISAELHKITRGPIMSFVPLKNRKEYRDNIMGMGQTPNIWVGGDKKKILRELEERNNVDAKKGRRVSAANRGKLVQVFAPLQRGSLATIASEDGSQSQNMSLERSSSLHESLTPSEASLGGEMMKEGGTGNQQVDIQQQILMQRQMFLEQQMVEMQAVSRVKVMGGATVEKKTMGPVTSVGLMGRRMAPLEVTKTGGMYERADKPITITDTLKATLLRQRGVTSGGGF